MTHRTGSQTAAEAGKSVPRPGSDPNALTGHRQDQSVDRRDPALRCRPLAWRWRVLWPPRATCVFQGDLNRRFRAFDADTGKSSGKPILGGNRFRSAPSPMPAANNTWRHDRRQSEGAGAGRRGPGAEDAARSTTRSTSFRSREPLVEQALACNLGFSPGPDGG